jgi:hypothetical protein
MVPLALLLLEMEQPILVVAVVEEAETDLLLVHLVQVDLEL